MRGLVETGSPWRPLDTPTHDESEWLGACARRHSILIEGSRASTESMLRAMKPHLHGPVFWRHPWVSFTIPPLPYRTVVLRDIALLGAEDQTRLLAWLDEAADRRQVIGTTTSRLFSFVEQGLFSEALYYRVNTMLLRMDAALR